MKSNTLNDQLNILAFSQIDEKKVPKGNPVKRIASKRLPSMDIGYSFNVAAAFKICF